MHHLQHRAAISRVRLLSKLVRSNISTPTVQIINANSNGQTLSSTYSPNQSQSSQLPSKLKHHEIIQSNKMISSYIRSGDLNSAVDVFLSMKIKTNITWNSMLAGFSRKPGKLEDAKNLFDKIPEPDTVSYNTMLACYFKNASIDAAKDYFSRIPIRDIASWNTMVFGLLQNGCVDEAKELFSAMSKRNTVTWNALVSGYVEAGKMESALELLAKTPVKGVVAWTCIITGYMRYGSVEMAEKIFQEIPEKFFVTWNAMIAGYVENSRGEDGLKLF